MEDKLIVAKTKLMAALMDNAPTYLNNLKLWFKGKYTREEFDIASRKLLGFQQIHLHNQFFLAILNKVDALNQPQTTMASATMSSPTNSAHFSKSGKKRKRSSRMTDQATFEPVEIYDYLPEECSEFVRPPTIPGGLRRFVCCFCFTAELDFNVSVSFSSFRNKFQSTTDSTSEIRRSGIIFAGQWPHNGKVMKDNLCSMQEIAIDFLCRLLVAAWETGGLVNADDTCCELIVSAVQVRFSLTLSSSAKRFVNHLLFHSCS